MKVYVVTIGPVPANSQVEGVRASNQAALALAATAMQEDGTTGWPDEGQLEFDEEKGQNAWKNGAGDKVVEILSFDVPDAVI